MEIQEHPPPPTSHTEDGDPGREPEILNKAMFVQRGFFSFFLVGSYLEVNAIPLVAQILQSHLRPLFHDLILKNIFKVEPVLVDCLDPELLRRENLTQHCHNRPGQRGFLLQN